jgi:hypothetical protein
MMNINLMPIVPLQDRYKFGFRMLTIFVPVIFIACAALVCFLEYRLESSAKLSLAALQQNSGFLQNEVDKKEMAIRQVTAPVSANWMSGSDVAAYTETVTTVLKTDGGSLTLLNWSQNAIVISGTINNLGSLSRIEVDLSNLPFMHAVSVSSVTRDAKGMTFTLHATWSRR